MGVTEPNDTIDAPWARPFDENTLRNVFQTPDIEVGVKRPRNNMGRR
jgi:hypothetical protein